MKKFLVATFFLLLSLRAMAEEAAETKEEEVLESKGIELPMIVVTPTKYETPLYNIPSSFTVIYEDEILSEGKPQVKDILQHIPGLNVVQAGSFGSTTSIFTRGTGSSHTLVMIDGVKVCDPTSTNGAFNFANLTLDNTERIEVLRGPYSTLYGSDAIGGVINIITKKGMGKPKVWASFESGSYMTFKEAIGSYGEFKGLHYSATFSRLNTEGISKADAKYDNDEKDSYANTSFSSRVDYEPYDKLTVGSTFRYTDAEIEIDDSGGYRGDDPNRRNRERLSAVSSYMNCDLTDWWTLDLKWLWMGNERFDKDFKDDIDTNEYLYSKYKGANTSYELHNVFKLGEFGTLSGGIDYDKEESDSYLYSQSAWGTTILDSPKVKDHNVGYYLQNSLTMGENFYSIIGFRIDDHSTFGTYDTYKVSAKYVFDWGTSIKGGWATGFKAPSLYQLYDPSNGNTILRPEKSETYEIGLGQNLLGDKIQLESTYFYTELDDLIDWVLVDPLWFTGQYKNINRAKIWGIENLVTFKPIDQIKINYSYTYLDTQNEVTKQSLDRRPRSKHALSLEIKPIDKLDFNLSYLYVGNRKDRRWVGGNETQIILKGYHKVDFSGRYIVSKNFEIFGRIENLLDEYYQEVDGYGTPGISFYGGGKVTF
jgi:vitamin B12 transporter